TSSAHPLPTRRSSDLEVFVESTAALGASPWRLTALHVLPNIASPIIVRASIGMGFTILTAAALGFLGLGPPPPTPEWGRTIAERSEEHTSELQSRENL